MGISETRPPCWLAEWYRPGLTEDQLDHTAARLDEIAALVSAEGSAVCLLLTLAVPSDEVIFGVFAAGSAHIVAQTCQRAGIPAQRLTASIGARITAPVDGETRDSSAAGTP